MRPGTSFFQSQNTVIDCTDYPNVNDLYAAADILISDYSSAFFDYGLLGKPMFCYADDYDRYRDEYGLFMDMEHEFPNGVFRSEEKLVSFIKEMDYEEESKKSNAYCASYVSHKVNATKCCLDALYNAVDAKMEAVHV